MPPKRKADAGPEKEVGGKKAKQETKAQSESGRKSGREKKAPISYAEDSMIEESEKPKVGSYPMPQDPPGMKSTAYMCKHPAGEGSFLHAVNGCSTAEV